MGREEQLSRGLIAGGYSTHSQHFVIENRKKGEVPDRINGTYFETKIHKLYYIKCTCESKLVSSANDGLAAVELHKGYQKLFVNEYNIPKSLYFLGSKNLFSLSFI